MVKLMNYFKGDSVAKNALILIVEENDALRTSLREWIFKTFPECCFLEAKTGEDAVNLISIHFPDIVIMDNNIAGIKCFDTIKIIKNKSSQTCVIILSDYDYEPYREDVMRAGASSFIIMHKIHNQLITVLSELFMHRNYEKREQANYKKC